MPSQRALYDETVPPILYLIVQLIGLGLAAWAFIDCLVRPAQAFPAVDRQTKYAWLIFTGLVAVIVLFFGAFSLLGVPAIVVAVYYLVDVRAKVTELTRS